MRLRHTAVLVGLLACSSFAEGSSNTSPDAASTLAEAGADDAATNDAGASSDADDATMSDPELGDGRDGVMELTARTSSWLFNEATTVESALPAGAKHIELRTLATQLRPGDFVLVWQPTGVAVPSASGSAATYALGPNDGAGRFEIARVAQSGNTSVDLEAPTRYAYDLPAQVVRVPQFTKVIIAQGATLRPAAWDGASGGIIAFVARETVRIDGVLSASSVGLRGGKAERAPTLAGCTGVDGDLTAGYAQKGEGIAGVAMTNGTGNVVTGAGGGACLAAGGGGGGHIGSGGSGGKSSIGDQGGRGAAAGKPGAATSYAVDERLVMGSGGGAGEGNLGFASGGGRGGGVVFVHAARITGSGTIAASGATAADSSGDGAGGGGAGGTVFLWARETISCGHALADGGDGGDQTASYQAGPGGGGAGGLVRLVAPRPPVCATSAKGGKAGVVVAFANTPWGATAGASGKVLLP